MRQSHWGDHIVGPGSAFCLSANRTGMNTRDRVHLLKTCGKSGKLGSTSRSDIIIAQVLPRRTGITPLTQSRDRTGRHHSMHATGTFATPHQLKT